MAVVALLAPLAAGCGDGRIGRSGQDAKQPDIGPPPDSGGSDGGVDASDAGPVLRDGGRLPDGGPALPYGEGDTMLEAGGRVREVHLLVPDAWTPGGPCMVALHGNGGSPEELLSWSDLDRVARDEGLAIGALRAIPEHADGFDWDRDTSLSDGNIDGAAVLASRDWLVSRGCDSSRVYLLGHRFGGMLAFRVAMEASMQFAAVHMSSAARPSGMGLVDAATRPIPVHILIGEDDGLFEEAVATRDELLADADYDDSRVELVSIAGLDCCRPRPLEGRIDDVWSWLSSWTL